MINKYNRNLLTVWPEQHCSSPQTPQQLAFSAARVQAELVCVTGLPDPLCLLHPEQRSREKRFNDTAPEQENSIHKILLHKKETLPFSYLLDTGLKNETLSR